MSIDQLLERVLLVGLLSFQTQIHAETKDDWVFVGKDNAGSAYISQKSIQRENDMVLVRTVLNIPETSNIIGVSSRAKSLVSIMAIDCQRWMGVIGDPFQYDRPFGEGVLLLSTTGYKNLSESEIQPIDPKHLLHKVAKSVCGKSGK